MVGISIARIDEFRTPTVQIRRAVASAALALACAGVFGAPAAAQFETRSISPAVAGPWGAAVGDFNHDGNLDLAVTTCILANQVTILLGNGDGTFRAPVSYALSDCPDAPAVGDFNRDGNLDLAVALTNRTGPGSVSVLLGNGDGAFQQAVNYPMPQFPCCVEVGDFNNDHIPDLIAFEPNGISVLLGNGDGTFQEPAITTVPPAQIRANIYLTHRAFSSTIPYMKEPKTLQEAIVYFSDPNRAFDFAVTLCWPDGKVKCPRCGSAEHRFVRTRRIWFCKGCKKQFSVKVGTIFEDSPLPLDKWMTAFWMLCNCKNGVSSMEIHRALGITQKSAWFMLQRLRLAMQDDFFGSKLGGEVEVDESFIGGKARNMHLSERKHRITGTGTKDKTAVMGILERGGKIRTTVVPNRKKAALQGEVRKHVEAGAALYSDALLSYEGLATDYAHKVVDHAVQYVDGRVHTNGLENFWSLLKRGISGTYVSVEPFHLFRYLDEQTFRFNNRKDMGDSDRFKLAMSNVIGKRLTYSQLTGKDGSPRHETTGTRETPIPF